MHTLRHIWPQLTLDTAKMITHSVVSLRLDYANTLLHQPQQSASGTEHTGQGDVFTVLSAPRSYTDNYTGCQSKKRTTGTPAYLCHLIHDYQPRFLRSTDTVCTADGTFVVC